MKPTIIDTVRHSILAVLAAKKEASNKETFFSHNLTQVVGLSSKLQVLIRKGEIRVVAQHGAGRAMRNEYENTGIKIDETTISLLDERPLDLDSNSSSGGWMSVYPEFFQTPYHLHNRIKSVYIHRPR